MQITAVTAGALLAALPLVNAVGNAVVYNKCDFPVWVWSVNTDGSSAEDPVKVSPGDSPYSESYKTLASGGVSLKMSNNSACTGPITQFEYTLDGFIWYDLSNVDCTTTACPFQKYGMYLESGAGCPTVSCPGGELTCKGAYTNPDDNENSLSCDSSADTVVYLCTDSGDGSSGSGSSSSSSSSSSESTTAAATTTSSKSSESSSSASASASAKSSPSSSSGWGAWPTIDNVAVAAASSTSAVASSAAASSSLTTLLTTAAPAAVKTVYTTVTAATTTTTWVPQQPEARHVKHVHHPRDFHH